MTIKNDSRDLEMAQQLKVVAKEPVFNPSDSHGSWFVERTASHNVADIYTQALAYSLTKCGGVNENGPHSYQLVEPFEKDYGLVGRKVSLGGWL